MHLYVMMSTHYFSYYGKSQHYFLIYVYLYAADSIIIISELKLHDIHGGICIKSSKTICVNSRIVGKAQIIMMAGSHAALSFHICSPLP